MAEIAKQIVVKRQGDEVQLLVDGETFPWAIGLGVDLHVDRTEVPGVTLTLLADEVQVEDRQRKPSPPATDWLLVDATDGTEIAPYSTTQRIFEDDIVTAPDGAYWRVEKIDIAAKCLRVAPYSTDL